MFFPTCNKTGLLTYTAVVSSLTVGYLETDFWSNRMYMIILLSQCDFASNMYNLRFIFRLKQLRVTQGVGQFVPASCGSEFVFSRLWEREKVNWFVIS